MTSLYTSLLVLQLILTVSPGWAAVVEGLWVTVICPLHSETQQEENHQKKWTIFAKTIWCNVLNAVKVSLTLEEQQQRADDQSECPHLYWEWVRTEGQWCWFTVWLTDALILCSITGVGHKFKAVSSQMWGEQKWQILQFKDIIFPHQTLIWY